ncbi:MAG TPA: hypothetical protein VN648_33340 [Candidatus Methylomirabilis sp.]|nr:hypothetical protein [Candidatus Methylomirabilis sp.]
MSNPLHLTEENKDELRKLATLVMAGVQIDPSPMREPIGDSVMFNGVDFGPALAAHLTPHAMVNQLAINIYNSSPLFDRLIDRSTGRPASKNWQGLPSWEAHQKRRLKGY